MSDKDIIYDKLINQDLIEYKELIDILIRYMSISELEEFVEYIERYYEIKL